MRRLTSLVCRPGAGICQFPRYQAFIKKQMADRQKFMKANAPATPKFCVRIRDGKSKRDVCINFSESTRVKAPDDKVDGGAIPVVVLEPSDEVPFPAPEPRPVTVPVPVPVPVPVLGQRRGTTPVRFYALGLVSAGWPECTPDMCVCVCVVRVRGRGRGRVRGRGPYADFRSTR